MGRKLGVLCVSVATLIGLIAFVTAAFGRPATHDRIVQEITSGSTTRLSGSVHPRARAEFDRGPADPSLRLARMSLVFKPTAAQQQELEQLLAEQQDPHSSNYHRWLTPEEFGTRFGLSDSDINKVASWLAAQGFTIVERPRSRTSISFSGTAAQVKAAFHTEIHRYEVNGKTHFANASDPELPAALAEVTLGIRSLHNFSPKPRARVKHVKPQFTSNISGNHFLAPADFATIYNLESLYAQGIDGTGQSIAIMGQTNISLSDIRTFRSVSNLPASDPQLILASVDGKDPGIVSGDIDEANLDIEWAGAVAPNATIIYVYADSSCSTCGGVFDAMQYTIDHNVAPVISISYGDCEANFSKSDIDWVRQYGQKANAQGQTIIGPSGDSGAADCDYSNGSTTVTSATHGLAVDVPASAPEVTGVGGSRFTDNGNYWSAVNDANNGSAVSYIPEQVWNDTAIDKDLSAGGGGVSKLFAKPAWQVATGVPADGQRDVPDITFAASADHDGYITCSQGSCVNGYRKADTTLSIMGGTSAGTPTFAAIVVLLNQKYGAQGNVNPKLYALAASVPAAFTDITSGNNRVPCTTGTTNCPAGASPIGYDAGPGYDLATGLGSVNACQLVTTWNGGPANCPAAFKLGVGAWSLTTTRGTPVTTSVFLGALNGFSGSADLTCTVSSGLTGVTCSFDKTSIAPGATATLTLTPPKVGASVGHGPLPGRSPWGGAGALLFAGVLLAGSLGSRTVRNAAARNAGACVSLVLVCAVATVMIACGGGGNSSGSNPVQPSPVATSCTTVNAVQGQAMTPVTLSAWGGNGGPYTFSATGLPAGITMSSSGTISGTATTLGTYNYTVTVTDTAGHTGTTSCAMTVSGPPLTGTVTVQATSGSTTKTAQIAVTIN